VPKDFTDEIFSRCYSLYYIQKEARIPEGGEGEEVRHLGVPCFFWKRIRIWKGRESTEHCRIWGSHTAVVKKSSNFRNIRPSAENPPTFRRKCRLQFQDRRINESNNQHEAELGFIARSCWCLAWFILRRSGEGQHVGAKRPLIFNRLHGYILIPKGNVIFKIILLSWKLYGDGKSSLKWLKINFWVTFLSSLERILECHGS
jgi:hypothetical protein